MSSQAKSLQTDPVHKCWNLANCGQFTSTTILQTAISSQVPPSTILQTAPIRKNQILQTASYSQISKSCKLLSSYKYRNLANCSGSKVPKSWKMIHKFQHLANSRQFTSANILSTACHFTSAKILQTAVNSQVPNSCKLLTTKCQMLVNCSNSQVPRTATKSCCQFTSGKSLQTAPIHKCQELANCCQLTSANCLQTASIPKYQELQTAVNSQMPKTCKLLQFTSAKNLQTVVTSQVPKACKLLQVTSSKSFQNAPTYQAD